MSQEEERRAIYERKRNLILLIARYLEDLGMANTVECMAKESGALGDYVLCDNVDLDTIYMDYISYYRVKFGRPPNIAKRKDALNVERSRAASLGAKRSKMRGTGATSSKTPLDVELTREQTLELLKSGLQKTMIVSQCSKPVIDRMEENTRLLRPPLRSFSNYTPEWGELANIVCRDIVTQTSKSMCVPWDRVKGLNSVRDSLIESVITPIKYPKLFEQSAVRPWKCILLHGPPGTGKTLMARALCHESSSQATFFNVSASSIVSKWRGESEKLIRVLFDVAKLFAPSIVFIDEVDSLMSKRDSHGDHEASKRFKNELLTQIDGLEESLDVFLLASTNLPWDIDAAFLRRFERKLLIGLPDVTVRIAIIRELISVANHWSAEELLDLAQLSDGFSGDELRIAFKEAAMNRIRQAITLTNITLPDPSKHLQQITPSLLRSALMQIKPSSTELLPKHVLWNSQHNKDATHV